MGRSGFMHSDRHRAADSSLGGGDLLSSLARPRWSLFGQRVSSFHLCGVLGLLLALLLSQALVLHRGLSPWVMTALSAAAVGTFLLLAKVTLLLVGREALIYYHHEIGVTAVAALGLWIWDLPVLAYLDATLMGIGIFLACGRVGCLMVGCCHGRPWHWGVRYTEAHAQEGFTPHYVGVRLFPVPILESLWALALVVMGSAWILAGAAPGEAFTLYVVAYAVVRFFLEFLRGDPDRPFLGGFSEAQWTSLAVILASVAGGLAGWLPFHPWHAAAAVALAGVMAAVALRRRWTPVPRYRLRHPAHVREVAQALSRFHGPDEEAGDAPEIVSTSQGLRLSGGPLATGSPICSHVALSAEAGGLEDASVQVVAGIVGELRPDWRVEVLAGREPGVFHLLAERA